MLWSDIQKYGLYFYYFVDISSHDTYLFKDIILIVGNYNEIYDTYSDIQSCMYINCHKSFIKCLHLVVR